MFSGWQEGPPQESGEPLCWGLPRYDTPEAHFCSVGLMHVWGGADVSSLFSVSVYPRTCVPRGGAGEIKSHLQSHQWGT